VKLNTSHLAFVRCLFESGHASTPFKDGRFAQHLRFRYVAFNILMRRQVNTKSGFFLRKIRPEQGDLTIDDLRLAFQGDTVESQVIINAITRF
jgi:hypothetical protein